MKTLELKPNFYWVGILDTQLRVFDIIMETEFGTTYNSYLLKGSEKTVLFETAKVKFADEYLEALSKLTEISKIDYIVVNHTEPDHAGSVERLIRLNPNIKIVGTTVAIRFLKDIVNDDFYSVAVKEGDSLSLGDKTLKFMSLPNLHWPDTMYTYIVEDKILLPCDSFGAHYCLEEVLLSKVTKEEEYQKALKYYFDNIIGPFKPYMEKALDRIEDLDIDMICTGHGPVIDCRIQEIKEIYKKWCSKAEKNVKKTVVIPYVSAYGYTEILAKEIQKGIEESGDILVESYDMVTADKVKVEEALLSADGILFGTPTIVGEALKPIWELTISMFSGTHGGKLASAFGSYGWSGEGVPNILERLRQLRMKVMDGFTVKFKPKDSTLLDAFDYGYQFGCTLLNKENTRKKDKGKRSMVKCLVCGEIFDSSIEICPVCGVSKENFISVEVEENQFKNNTDETFLVLGNGVAGLNAAIAIRERNETGKIVMVTNETVFSYNRPMLTKSMIASFEADQILIHEKNFYKEKQIEVVLGKEVTVLDPVKKEVTLCDGTKYSYDKCIYALGSESFVPPITGVDQPGVMVVRRLSDAKKIHAMLPKIQHAIVIGGGVLGLEAAWELKKGKCKVTVLELADKLMERQLDVDAGMILKDFVEKAGVAVKLGVQIEAIEADKQVTGVRLAGGEVLPADLVLLSCGVRGNTVLAKEAGLMVNRNIVVNEKMETSQKDIYACGDCAEFEGTTLAIWPEAIEMGKVAGANATGDSMAYEMVPRSLTFQGMNTSLFASGDVGKQQGISYKTVEFKDLAKRTYEKYYFAKNRFAGVILIGDLKKIAFVTKALEEHRTYQKMFQIVED